MYVDCSVLILLYNQAFQKAWDIACSTPGSVFLVPQGRTYLVNATRFQGPCSDRLVIQVINMLIFTLSHDIKINFLNCS